MTRWLRSFSILLAALAVVGGTWQFAQARSEQPIDGSPGDAGAHFECPAGQQLVGFSGRTGLWIDRIQAMCAPLLAGGHLGQPVALGQQVGGAGGGAIDRACPRDAAVTSVYLNMTTRKRQVAAINMTCTSLSTGEHFPVAFGNPDYTARCPGIGVGNCPADENSSQSCSNGDVPIGMNVRYGKDVNGFGLVCARVVAAAPPPVVKVTGKPVLPPPPPPPPAQKPIKTTGKPRAPAATTMAFTGAWNTVTGQNGHFLMILTPQNAFNPAFPQPIQYTGTFTNTDGEANTNGTLRGTVVFGSTQMTYTYVQPGLGQSGQGVFNLTDGNTFTGNGVSSAKANFTWNGTRKP